MAEYTEQELKKSIEQGNFSNVYFFYGEEKMLMESAVKKLVHQATGNQFLDFNYQNFDGDSLVYSYKGEGNAKGGNLHTLIDFFLENNHAVFVQVDLDNKNSKQQQLDKHMAN